MLVDAIGGTGGTITSAIRTASRATGASFDFLLNTAIRESALDPGAKAKTSSARGLYQFIESTWLATLKEEGAKYGLGAYSAAIDRLPGGRYGVRDPSAREHILKLREDPEIAALMAGALAGRNGADLSATLGRKPTSGELYMAHFLGAAGAKRLLAMNPQTSAASAFPEAARANQSIFFHRDGSAKTAAQVQASLTARLDQAPAQMPLPKATMALAAVQATTASGLPEPPVAQVVYEHPISPGRTAFANDAGPVLHSLFRTGANDALSSAVRELWGGGEAGSRARGGEPLDLQQYLKPGLMRGGRRGA